MGQMPHWNSAHTHGVRVAVKMLLVTATHTTTRTNTTVIMLAQNDLMRHLAHSYTLYIPQKSSGGGRRGKKSKNS